MLDWKQYEQLIGYHSRGQWERDEECGNQQEEKAATGFHKQHNPWLDIQPQKKKEKPLFASWIAMK